MNIEIKKSKNPIKYDDAIRYMENRLNEVNQKSSKELIWLLTHDDIYTAGTSYKENEILDKSIKIVNTNRGGKITYHGPGQLICYFVIDLRKKKDIRVIYTQKYIKKNGSNCLDKPNREQNYQFNLLLGL